MGSQTPAGPLFLRPGWVQPAPPDQISLLSSGHKHKHRMCLAGLSALSSPSKENQGKLLTKLLGPAEQ
jgi:hypothetical protein